MKHFYQFTKNTVFLVLFFVFIFHKNQAQNIRYQTSLMGGLTVAANGLLLDDSPITYVNTAGGRTMSFSSDLVLPAGSTIVKAILYVEGYAAVAMTSVNFKFPGAGSYTTLNTASPGFL